VLKLGHLRLYIRNTQKVLKCGAGERWRKLIWTNHVRNKELQRVKEDRNILQTIQGRKPNWIGHISHRNCLLKHIIEGKIQGRI
jgi:hypothetical protein